MEKFQNKKTLFILCALIVVLMIINIIPGLVKGLGNFVYKIFSPFERIFSNAGKGIVGFFQILISIGDLNKQNLALQEKNTTLESEIAKLNEVEKENLVLKNALNISKSGQPIKEVALIVGKDIQGTQDWILINKGSKQGILRDMIVLSPENALVGRINEVSSDFSKVMLITYKDSAIAGILENQRIEGLIKKSDKGGLFMDFIPKTEKFELGERIITSGMDNLYPKGILIGTIENIDPSDNQIFQKITITPAVNFSKLEQVIIIK